MSEQTQGSAETQGHGAQAAQGSQEVLHRVCIQCNNMFRVTAKNFDAKQCPNCHKG